MTEEKTQIDKFKEAARELECDDGLERLRDPVGKLVKHKPAEKPIGWYVRVTSQKAIIAF
jgi:hypothetical protein